MTVKKLLFVAFIVPFVLFAQEPKKVAVLETKRGTESVSDFHLSMVRGGMETAVSNSKGYIAYDRSALEAIMGELQFQMSGLVSDADIKKIGEMAGAQYVLVTEASVDEGYMFIIAKILDVETGRYDKSYDALCEAKPVEIKKSCAEIGRKLFGSETVVANNGANNSAKNISNGSDIIEVKVRNVTFEMVKVKAGTFVMGCTSEQGNDCDSDESPYHKVTISKDYYIGRYEVSQELWEAVMGNNPSKFVGFDNPVEMVNYNECLAFCSELSRLTGKQFRLPTEAEWEYAARGGHQATVSAYAGSSIPDNVAWHSGNSASKTHTIGQKSPNELGIYDMSGNVWEWCSDWYKLYPRDAQTDPTGPAYGSYRIIRGGSWYENAASCRVANRKTFPYSNRFYDLGLRVVLIR